MSEIRRIDPGIWLLEAETEGFDVRACLVVGEKEAILWDTLASPADLAGIADLLRGRSPTVVYSHGDWDHVWGTGGLPGDPKEILAHEACLPRFSAELPQLLEEKTREDPAAFRGVELHPPTRTFRDRWEIPLGGDLTLELHPLPGHTPDSVVGFIPQWGVLLAGDAVETPLPFVNTGSPLEIWAQELEAWTMRLEARARELGGQESALGGQPGGSPLVIPSHGPLGGPELLTRNAEYLRSLLAGEEPSVPERLSPFYRETHAGNLRIAEIP